MGDKQRKIGSIIENYALDYLASKGYWCHLFAKGPAGQPCDIIALRGDIAYLLDVKHCNNYILGYSRIEPNQHTAFQLAQAKGVRRVGFLCRSDVLEGWRYVPYGDMFGHTNADLRDYAPDNIE